MSCGPLQVECVNLSIIQIIMKREISTQEDIKLLVDVFYRNYHKMGPWGMNLIKVGSSLGAGGFALMEKGELIQLQTTKLCNAMMIFVLYTCKQEIKHNKYKHTTNTLHAT